jgi:hypothetical protein
MAGVRAGILPVGGSTMSDVRRPPTRVPRSHQKSLYAPVTSCAAVWPRASSVAAARARRSTSAISDSVRNSLATFAGRSSGVTVPLDQTPCRSGAPHAVRGALENHES